MMLHSTAFKFVHFWSFFASVQAAVMAANASVQLSELKDFHAPISTR
jgi:hypothetical protein